MKFILDFRKKYSGEFSLIITFFIVFLLMAFLSPSKFLSSYNLQTMAFQMPEFGLMSLAMMIAVLTGGINLSITMSASLSSIIASFILSSQFTYSNPIIGIILGIITILISSILLGAFNGFFIAYIGVAPMLVTLGTKTLYEGIGLNFTKGGSISGFPLQYMQIGNGSLFGMPVSLLVYILVIILCYFLFERSAWGTKVYMIGSNEVASKFSGIDTKRVLMGVYIYSSLLTGIASIFITSRYNSAKTDYGSSYLMQAVTAVVLGGTSISGGNGKVIGTVIAVCIIQVISTGLNIMQVNRYIINIITGGILILVLALRYITNSMEDKRKIKERLLNIKN